MIRKATKNVYTLYAALVIFYTALIFLLTPISLYTHHFHTSVLHVRITLFAFAIPYFLIWLAGFYGYERLKSYAQTIIGSKDGKIISRLALGILFLVLWPPFSSIGDSVRTVIILHVPNLTTSTLIINSYFHLVWPLVGTILIASAARQLMDLAHLHISYRALYSISLITVIVGIGFAYAIIRISPGASVAYPLPLPLTLSTLVVPRTYIWFLGLLSVYQIFKFQREAKGVVYRYCWRLLAYGIGAVILLHMFHSFLDTFSAQLGRLSLGAYLLVVYIVLFLLAISYLIVAQGARKLRRIEEV